MPELRPTKSETSVVIACGGTGGHLFPGMAVGHELLRRGCIVTLMVSPKDVDQQAIQSITDMGVVTLPSVGMQRGGLLKFLAGFWKSYRMAGDAYALRKPDIAVAMGGFTSAPPILAAKRCGAKTFLHESNTIPGKANRWLSRIVDGAFVFFPETAARLKTRDVEVVGMPVRSQFLQNTPPAEARGRLGLQPSDPVLLIMGGSQGARGINDLIIEALPTLRQALPQLQFVHLTGAADFERVQSAYSTSGARAVVRPFFAEMGNALAAATLAVTRAGASSLAELAACRLPAILIPFPAAADDHQFHNARAFAQSGAAWIVDQKKATPAQLAEDIIRFLNHPQGRDEMQRALAQWHRPDAAAIMADKILRWTEKAQLNRAMTASFEKRSLHV